MTTVIRDAVMQYVQANPGKFHRTTAIARAIGYSGSTTSSTVYKLTKQAVLSRRRVEEPGSVENEYTAGPRLDWGLKFIGHRMPSGKNRKVRRAAKQAVDTPVVGESPRAANGVGAGVVLRFDGSAHAVQMAEARAIYDDLRVLFGE